MPIIQQIYSTWIYFPFVLGALFSLFIYDVFKCIPGRRWLILLFRECAYRERKERKKEKEKIYVLFVHGDGRHSHLEIV
jgi:hypothetical protein